MTDDEPLRPYPVVAVTFTAGSHVDLLDPQVARDTRVPAGPGQRRGGLGVRMAQLLGVDVVPAAAGQVRPVGAGGEPAVGDPDHPVQVPPGQVVLDGADDRGVVLVAGERPAPDRCPVAGDCHRDDYLRQVGPEVLGVTEGPLRLLARAADPVGALDLPVRARGVSFYRLIRCPPPVATRREDRLPCLWITRNGICVL